MELSPCTYSHCFVLSFSAKKRLDFSKTWVATLFFLLETF